MSASALKQSSGSYSSAAVTGSLADEIYLSVQGDSITANKYGMRRAVRIRSISRRSHSKSITLHWAPDICAASELTTFVLWWRKDCPPNRTLIARFNPSVIPDCILRLLYPFCPRSLGHCFA